MKEGNDDEAVFYVDLGAEVPNKCRIICCGDTTLSKCHA